MVFAKHGVVTNALDTPLIPMGCGGTHEALSRGLVAAVSERNVEDGANRFVQTIQPVALRVDVPRLLLAQLLPLFENQSEVVAKLGVAPVGMSPAIGDVGLYIICLRHTRKLRGAQSEAVRANTLIRSDQRRSGRDRHDVVRHRQE